MTNGAAITPDPLQVELDFYKERNYVIQSRNELLEKENLRAHNEIRELKIQAARDAHPAGKGTSAVNKSAIEYLSRGMTDEQKSRFLEFMEDEDG